MAQSPVRLWVMAGAAASALLAFAAFMLLVAPQRATAADHRLQLSEAEAQSDALRTRGSVLAAQLEEIDARRAALEVKRESLPGSNDLEALVQALTVAAAANGVTVEEVTAAAPVDIAKPAAAAPAAAVLAPDTAAAQPVAEPDAAGAPLFALPVTVRASGTMAAVESFLRAVQAEQPRAILFNSLTMVPNVGGATLADSVMLTAQTRVFVATPRVAATTVPTG